MILTPGRGWFRRFFIAILATSSVMLGSWITSQEALIETDSEFAYLANRQHQTIHNEVNTAQRYDAKQRLHSDVGQPKDTKVIPRTPLITEEEDKSNRSKEKGQTRGVLQLESAAELRRLADAAFRAGYNQDQVFRETVVIPNKAKPEEYNDSMFDEKINLKRKHRLFSEEKNKSGAERKLNYVNDDVIRTKQDDKMVLSAKHDNPKGYSVTKVLLVGYMRGGTTFLESLFSANENNFVLFEVLDGIYTHLYSTDWNWRAFDIFYDINNRPRTFPDYETDFAAKTVLDILNCRLDGLPIEILTHQFITHRHDELALGPYRQCLNVTKVIKSYHCATYTSRRCMRYFENEAHHPCHNQTVSDELITRRLEKRKKCQAKFIERVKSCLPKLQNTCERAKNRVIKTIRLPVQVIARIVELDSNIKVINLFRDPRGVVASRKTAHMLSWRSGNSTEIEAKLLCFKMQSDLKQLRLLRQRHLSIFMEIKYEDMAVSPLMIASKIYRFLGQTIPKVIVDAIRYNTRASSENGTFGTHRKNSTETAFAWKHKITQEQKYYITNSCRDVMEMLNYLP